jgi:hypothetical protein
MGRKLGRSMVETLVVAAGNHRLIHDSALGGSKNKSAIPGTFIG